MIRRVPWLVLAAVLGIMIAGRYYEYRALGEPQGGWLSDSIMGLAFMAFPAVGALVASRRPENRFGWLLLVIGAWAAILVAASGYASYAIGINRDVTPLSTLGAWLFQWMWFPLIGSVPTFAFLLFPTGTLPSPRWRWVARATGVVMAAIVLPSMFQERLVGDNFNLDNPIGLSFITDAEKQLGFVFLGFLPLVILSVLSLGFRYRKASIEERQQMKWVGLAALLLGIGITLGESLDLPEAIFPILLLGLPVSLGVAILKYRLYDIDLVINRTLVYGALTAFLAGAYFGFVLLFQSVVPGAGDSDLAVAASTLAVAALFRPARARVQGFIDRRFYRRKYDAQRTLQGFTGRLRDEVELTSLRADVLDVVRTTLQPQGASLWLRDLGEPR